MGKKKIAKRKAPKEADDGLTFEQALGELEKIVTDLETGNLGLAESLERYEQGVSHLKRCQTELDRAERRIDLLCGMDAQGNPVTETFDSDDEEALEAKAGARAKKRTAKTGKNLFD